MYNVNSSLTVYEHCSDLEFRQQQHTGIASAPKSLEVSETKWKELQKETNCWNMKIRGQCNHVPAEAKLNGEWVKILQENLSEKGECLQEKQLLPLLV